MPLKDHVLAVAPSLERRCATPGEFAASLEALTDAQLNDLHGQLGQIGMRAWMCPEPVNENETVGIGI